MRWTAYGAYSQVLDGFSRTEIARELNRKEVRRNGKQWEPLDVYNIVTNPKYAGCNVWHRGSARLRNKRVRVDAQNWIMKPGAFTPIIDQETFDRAQAVLPRRADYQWSDAEILKKLRRLLAAKGRLSESLILRARGMPSTSTLHRHLGSYRNMYKAVGYHIPDEDVVGGDQAQASMRLRRQLVEGIRDMFPKNVSITHLPNRSRSILRIDDTFMVSVLLSRLEMRGREQPRWAVYPNPAEREYITLFCTLGTSRKRILSYRLFPSMNIRGNTHYSYKGDPWLRTGTRLIKLSDFYDAVKRVWQGRQASSMLSLAAGGNYSRIAIGV